MADGAPTGFVPGDHASTFGGNPVSCAAACAVIEEIDDELLAHVREVGELRARSCRTCAARACCWRSSSGGLRGLLAHAALERNLLVGTAGRRRCG